MDVEAELSGKFHNLPGVTVGEKKKSFNAFVNELNSKISQENLRIEFITNLKSRNKLDTSFQLQLLLHYGAHEKLLELLKCGNSFHVGKILKNSEFFKETVKNINADVFVNEILPQVSYSTRMKLINRISKNLLDEKRANEYFEAIESKYGIISAQIMLPYCSAGVIKTKIQKYNLILSRRQLTVLLKRNLDFFEYYFMYLENNPKVKYYDKAWLWRMVLEHDSELFFKLAKTYNYKDAKVGKRLSKRILKDNQNLLNDLDNKYLTLANRTLYQQLRKKPELFQQFIATRIECDKDNFCYTCLSSYTKIGGFTNCVSKERRYKFMNDIFKQKFGENLHDNPKLIPENLFLSIPASIRNDVLRMRIKDQERLIYLCPIETSVPYIMDKIKHCSDMNKRAMYLDLLYKTCEFNEDSKYLLELLQYVQKRYRNDINSLRTFFSNLWSWPDIELLSTEHWQCIDAIQRILSVQNINIYEFYGLEKRIGYLLRKNSEISEEMQSYVEILKNKWCRSIFAAIPLYRKACIFKVKTYIDKIEDQKLMQQMQVQYLNFVHDYNQSAQSDDKISMLSFLPLIKTLLNEHLSGLREIITFYVRLHFTDFNPIIWQSPQEFFTDHSLFSWYLLHHKDEILNKLDALLNIPSIKKNSKFIRELSLYSFRNIPEKITTNCINTIKEGTDTSLKTDAVRILIQINDNAFLNIVALFPPAEDGKINVEEPSEKINLQQAILANFKNISNPVEGLELFKKFCKGDYLKYTLRPLYSITIRLPEKVAVPFVETLHKMAVSVRKHAIHISKIIFSLKDFCDFVRNEFFKETNMSLKTVLFKKTLEYASIMPTAEFWELLKVTMHGIDKNDVEAHNLLLSTSKVPKEYKAEFIAEAYKQFDSNLEPSINLKKWELIRIMPSEVVDQLNYQILETFLSEILFTQFYSEHPQCWLNIIFYSHGEKRNNLYNFALTKFKKYNSSKNYPDVSEEQFMQYLCINFLKFHSEYSMVHKFSTTWFEKFKPVMDLRRWIYIHFVETYAEVEYNIRVFVKKANELLGKFLGNYNSCLFDFFAREFENFLSNIGNVNMVQFVTLFLEESQTIPVFLLSIRLLSKYRVTDCKEEMDSYLTLLTKFKAQSDNNIKVYLREYFPEHCGSCE